MLDTNDGLCSPICRFHRRHSQTAGSCNPAKHRQEIYLVIRKENLFLNAMTSISSKSNDPYTDYHVNVNSRKEIDNK